MTRRHDNGKRGLVCFREFTCNSLLKAFIGLLAATLHSLAAADDWWSAQSNASRLESDDSLEIDRHPNSVRLVRVAGREFFEVLRRKLRWGER